MQNQGRPNAPVDLLCGIEQLIETRWLDMAAEFEATTAAKVRAAGMRCDVHVVDGNAKNRRLVCAAPLRHKLRSSALQRTIRTCCPKTPLLGSKFCKEHSHELDLEGASVDYQVIAHEVPAAVGVEPTDSFRLQIQQRDTEVLLWVEEDRVHPALVQQYFRNLGTERLDHLTARKRQRVLARKGWSYSVGRAMGDVQNQWESMTEEEKIAALPQRSSQADLVAVACNTHKETDLVIAQLAKTAGVLCVCLSSGIIVLFREIFGCESLSQRYFLMADLAQQYPECNMIVHDDACHLHRFTEARAYMSALAARIAPPRIRYVCDIFHMSGHIDEWCMTHCNPKAPDVAPTLEGIRTSVCEFTFTWLSGYKYQTKHMSEWGFKVFLLEVITGHNEAIFAGSL